MSNVLNDQVQNLNSSIEKALELEVISHEDSIKLTELTDRLANIHNEDKFSARHSFSNIIPQEFEFSLNNYFNQFIFNGESQFDMAFSHALYSLLDVRKSESCEFNEQAHGQFISSIVAAISCIAIQHTSDIHTSDIKPEINVNPEIIAQHIQREICESIAAA